ncbi:GGDEF domain-containing protein [Halodesulfovibrio sp.]|jgi:diguanylate cyclase (GGDEF)-like protein|uniref:GGDEF domain-containing protein n=1 Tax=Halodesulfovibrio sp. TaxID=1912772 RepID=UPI0025DA8B9C|nr:GGDEF domain-containing protein [Halodesulfovibrio sp.]MCT4625728.1 GGDEF domain-containing protein [Halodesulfovibrio sp.]
MLPTRELYASLAVTAAVSTAALFWLQHSHFSTKGVRWWATAMSSFLLSLVLIAFRGFIPPFLSKVLVNICATVGYLCFWYGIRAFFNRPLNFYVIACGVLLTSTTAIVSSLSLFLPQFILYKIITLSFSYSIPNVLSAYELLRYGRHSKTAKYLGYMNIASAFVNFMHGVLILYTHSFNTFFSTGVGTLVYILWSNGTLLFTTFGLIMLIVEELNAKLAQQAVEDPLTGLFNRRALNEVSSTYFTKSQQKEKRVGLLMLDIDHFKVVNDTYGHATGDLLLKHFANEVSCCLRATDSLYRMGGEEFLVIIPDCSAAVLQGLGERIRAHIEQTPLVMPHGTIHNTVSIGCSLSCASDSCLDSAIERADTALYLAKENGRNRVTMHEVAV